MIEAQIHFGTPCIVYYPPISRFLFQSCHTRPHFCKKAPFGLSWQMRAENRPTFVEKTDRQVRLNSRSHHQPWTYEIYGKWRIFYIVGASFSMSISNGVYTSASNKMDSPMHLYFKRRHMTLHCGQVWGLRWTKLQEAIFWTYCVVNRCF